MKTSVLEIYTSEASRKICCDKLPVASEARDKCFKIGTFFSNLSTILFISSPVVENSYFQHFQGWNMYYKSVSPSQNQMFVPLVFNFDAISILVEINISDYLHTSDIFRLLTHI